MAALALLALSGCDGKKPMAQLYVDNWTCTQQGDVNVRYARSAGKVFFLEVRKETRCTQFTMINRNLDAE